MTARRGWIALAATVVAVVGVHLWGDGAPELDRLFPEHRPAVDGSGVAGGNELTLVDVRTIDVADAPAGTQTLLVTFDVVPAPDADICGTPLLAETNGRGRTWTAAGTIPGWDPWESGTICGSDDGPGRASVGFLVSDDISDALRLEISGVALGETPLWFDLPR